MVIYHKICIFFQKIIYDPEEPAISSYILPPQDSSDVEDVVTVSVAVCVEDEKVLDISKNGIISIKQNTRKIIRAVLIFISES